MAARHQYRGGLLPRRFAEKLSRFYGREGCRLPRSDRLALLQKELSILEAEGVKPFDPRAAFFMVALLVESSDAEYAVASQKKRWVCYGKHLQTPYWQNLRWLALVAADSRCGNCGVDVSGGFDLHHLSYDELGYETLDTVAAWCRRCHADLHGVAA
jgi:hypothetical protein